MGYVIALLVLILLFSPQPGDAGEGENGRKKAEEEKKIRRTEKSRSRTEKSRSRAEKPDPFREELIEHFLLDDDD